MKKVNRKTNATIAAILVGAVIVSGCKGSNDNNNSTVQSNSTFDCDKISVEIDETNHVFTIKCDSINKDFRQEGKLLTYNVPATANVYKIYPFDDYQLSPLYNPIREWKTVSFQVFTLMAGQKPEKNNIEGKDSLSRAERISAINTLTRIDAADFKQMDVIKSGYSDVVFCDYAIRYTFPATKKDLYLITHFDLKLNYNIVLDEVKDRPLDYYIIRRSIDGITVGLPESAVLYYEKYDRKTRIGTYIYSEDKKTFYDGESIYEVRNNANASPDDIELYLKDQSVLPFEKAINKVLPAIYQMLSYSAKTGGESYFYAAELVYLTVGTTDYSDVDYDNTSIIYKDTSNAYIYPFWAFYVLDNQVLAGEDVAQCEPILVNAITGEVIICD